MKNKQIPVRCTSGTKIDLNELEPFQGTLKILTRGEYKKLREAILDKGIVFPLFFWRHEGHAYTLDGHQRTQLLKDLTQEGYTIEGGLVPADEIQADNVTEARELVLLATSQYAKIDQEGLYEFLSTSGINFDRLTEMASLPGIDFDRFRAGYLTDIPDEDEPAAIPKTPITQPGDLWEFEGHRLLCADARDHEAWATLMKGDRADLVFTDPPYNVDYKDAQGNTIKNDKLAREAFKDLLSAAFHNMAAYTSPGAPAYVCHASATQREFEDTLEAAGYRVRNPIIWVKLVATMGWGDYRWKHEPIFYAVKREAERTAFFGDRSEYTTWEEEKTDEELLAYVKRHISKQEEGHSTVWRLGRDPHPYDHPTQKPVKLVAYALRNSSKPGALILDPFAGAATTLIAAHQLQRRTRLMELDPRFIDAALTRFHRLLNQPGEQHDRGARTTPELTRNGIPYDFRTLQPQESTNPPRTKPQSIQNNAQTKAENKAITPSQKAHIRTQNKPKNKGEKSRISQPSQATVPHAQNEPKTAHRPGTLDSRRSSVGQSQATVSREERSKKGSTAARRRHAQNKDKKAGNQITGIVSSSELSEQGAAMRPKNGSKPGHKEPVPIARTLAEVRTWLEQHGGSAAAEQADGLSVENAPQSRPNQAGEPRDPERTNTPPRQEIGSGRKDGAQEQPEYAAFQDALGEDL